MNLSALDSLGPDATREYLEFLLKQYRTVDAFWFIRAEERHGLAEAELLNELVWPKVAELAARELKQRFNIAEKGLQGFAKALALFPWALIVGYEIKDNGDHLLIEIPNCPAQEARKKRGLGEYVCKEMHLGEFTAFAAAIDPAIRVECVFAPPEPHPEELYCRWRFSMPGENEK
jgi:hypothetical protein